MKTLKFSTIKFPGAVSLDEKLCSNLQDIAYCLELTKVHFRRKALILNTLLTRQTSEPGWTIAPVDTVCLMSTNVLSTGTEGYRAGVGGGRGGNYNVLTFRLWVMMRKCDQKLKF
jgi:hypothetical protein